MTDFSAVRLIMVDLDGTLLTGERTISPDTREAIAACRARGVRFAFNTGRPHSITTWYLDDLRPDASVMCYGAEIMVEGEMVRRRFLSAVRATEILKRCRGAEQIRYGTADGAMYEDPAGHWSQPMDRMADIGERINHICVWGLPEAEARAMPRACGCTLTQLIGSRWCNFSPRGCGKGAGTLALARMLGIAPAQIIAFGDETSDIPMFEKCLAGVAMANADPQTLAAADYVTASNNEDGIGSFLRRHVLPALPDRV